MGKSDYTFRYKVRNWPEYNRALVKRGQLTLWFDTEAVAAWRHPGPFEGRGRPKVYADAAIQCALVLNSVFHLNLRTTQEFLQSIVALMALDLPVPNYSTVSRRQSAVDVRLSVGPTDRPRHVVIDSTGLKIYGAGEWHIRKHRTLRRRTWRKLHLGVDETTKEIVAMDLTASNVHDARRLSSLLSKTALPRSGWSAWRPRRSRTPSLPSCLDRFLHRSQCRWPGVGHCRKFRTMVWMSEVSVRSC